MITLIVILLISGIIAATNDFVKNKATCNDYLKEYIKTLIQTTLFDSIQPIPSTEVGDKLLLIVAIKPLTPDQKEITITVSNAPDSGRQPYQITKTIIKMR